MSKVTERDLALFNIHPVVADMLKTDDRLTLSIDGKDGWVAILNCPDFLQNMVCSDDFESVGVTDEAHYFMHKESIYLVKIYSNYTDNPERINSLTVMTMRGSAEGGFIECSYGVDKSLFDGLLDD